MFERFQNLPFRQNATYAYLSSEVFDWAAIDASYTRGTNINYFPAQGLFSFLANSTDADLGLTLRPTPGSGLPRLTSLMPSILSRGLRRSDHRLDFQQSSSADKK